MKKKIFLVLFSVCLSILTTACTATQATPPTGGSGTTGATESTPVVSGSGEPAAETTVKPADETDGTEQTTASAQGETTTTGVGEIEPPVEDKTDILVVVFSATNTTKPLAEYIADGLGADLYEIVAAQPYTTADLNYRDDNSRSTKEMNDPNSRPAISGSVEDMSKYDIVFIGYPIWWGEAPRIVSTFIESYDFSGKTVIPFCTSGGSGIGSSGSLLAELTSGATWLPGRRFGGGTSRSAMLEWVNSLGLGVTAQ